VHLALQQLGDDAGRVDFAMLTVDPERDTPDVLTTFVHGFVDNGHALRARDANQLDTIVQAFGASSAVDHHQVGHTDYTYVVDDTGTVVLTWTTEMTVDDLINDFGILLDKLPG
jgi:protein SCO1/2